MNQKLFKFSAGGTGGGSGLVPRGNWDADTNTPDITSETTVGDYWVVSVAGTTDLGGITTWNVGDFAVKTSDGWLKIPATATTAYTNTFENADLTAGVLTVTHGLNDQHALVVVIEDNTGKQIVPDEIEYVSADAMTVDLTSFGTLTGTWQVRVIKAGGDGSGGGGGMAANKLTAKVLYGGI